MARLRSVARTSAEVRHSMSIPTLGSLTIDSDNRVVIPITDVGGNASVRVDYALYDDSSPPAETSRIWYTVDIVTTPSDVTTPVLFWSGYVWVRAVGLFADGSPATGYSTPTAIAFSTFPTPSDTAPAPEMGTAVANGMIYVAEIYGDAVTIYDTSTYFEVTEPVWTLQDGGKLFDMSGGNGRLTYVGIRPIRVYISCTVSMTAGANDQLHMSLGLNGVTAEASEVQRTMGASGDVGIVALLLITTMESGDYISLFIRNTTGANNSTVTVANIAAQALSES